jgi:putative ABC transport system substrate-binding protein
MKLRGGSEPHARDGTARVHHAARRRGCRLAARCARAAAGDAGGGIPRHRVAPSVRASRRRLPPGPTGNRLRRGPQRCDRVSLGRGPLRQGAGAGADLVRRQVAVIVTVGGETSAAAAKAATATIPIVFNTGSDPVRLGLVASLARPGGNATGVNIFTTELAEKRLGLLRDLVPAATTIAVLSNPNFAAAVANVRESEAAARAIGKEVVIFNASSDAEIETAFAKIVLPRPGALLVGADPFFNSRRGLIVALAARHAIPAIYEWREFAEAGGLISYGTSLVEAYRQQGIYAGRILKGEKPADLPVMQLSKFELVINLNTAKALSLAIPPGVLALADEVIE